MIAPAGAVADGDPASDVLAAQSLFLPQDGGVRPSQQARLTALLSAAQHQGFAIRVALIASPSDLGSITALWRMPSGYARFLGQELSLVFHGTLLVIMPNGAAVYRDHGAGGEQQTSTVSLGQPTAGASMGTAAITLVQGLAADSGHRLTIGALSAPRATSSGSALGGPVAGLVFLAGAALIAVAWAASLRARPSGLARHART